MIEKIIPQDAFKSKKNFEEFMASHNAPEIISVLADYPKANGKASRIPMTNNATQGHIY